MLRDIIKKEHILEAMREIDRRGVRRGRDSKKYDLVYQGTRYPPKYVVSLAHRVATGKELAPETFNGGKHTNSFLKKLGFTIVGKKGIARKSSDDDFWVDDEEGFPEGRKGYRLHRSFERNPKVVEMAKKKRWKEFGDLVCEVCGFSFMKRYGKLGERFIEAHHEVPVRQLGDKGETRIRDLALVCSNCHRMLHKGDLSIKELKKQLKSILR